MGCCFGCVGTFFPRLALFFVWVFTNLVDRAFTGFAVPLLGFIFLPFTTLMYVFVYEPLRNGPGALGWALVVLALLIDLSAYGGTGYTNRERMLRRWYN
ncbi:MAG: hypothetical protein ACLQUT_05945 [Thermoleophilia bacterium]